MTSVRPSICAAGGGIAPACWSGDTSLRHTRRCLSQKERTGFFCFLVCFLKKEQLTETVSMTSVRPSVCAAGGIAPACWSGDTSLRHTRRCLSQKQRKTSFVFCGFFFKERTVDGNSEHDLRPSVRPYCEGIAPACESGDASLLHARRCLSEKEQLSRPANP